MGWGQTELPRSCLTRTEDHLPACYRYIELNPVPYAEAKEMLGGFFLLGCATREESIEIARQCPAARCCSVEMREVGPCFDEVIPATGFGD